MKNIGLSELARRIGEPSISWLMKLTLERPEVISLAAGFTDNESLPVEDTRELLDEILGSKKSGRTALQYGTSMGDPILRELTALHLQFEDTGRSPKRIADAYTPGRMVVTNGSQQLLYLIAEALCDPGDIILLEDPTYFVFLGITALRGVRCRGIRMMPDGIDLEHLERVLDELARSGDLRRIKFLYLVSYFQNPSGVTTRFEKKLAALELLRRYERKAGHPIYLLEDAAYRELRFAGESVPSALAAPGGAERVIYTGTYSKPFASGSRVGFGLMPEELSKTVLRLKGNHDFGTSNLLQQLTARALHSGKYARHVAVLRKRYARKSVVMRDAIREHFPDDVDWSEAEGGLYIWARLPRRMKSGMKSRLFQRALAHDVVYVPGELCYAEDAARPRPNHEMRLSFGGAVETALRQGIERLGKAIHET
jgi:2-aminoadipate transaminase